MHKIVVANRGEIAVRIIRACHDLGYQTVALYSTADSEALHVLHANEAICIGDPPSYRSYLKIPNILSACEITGADAIHPGVGFLSESSNFASICESCGINFIGPSKEAIALLGDKASAKKTALQAGCPVIPGSIGVLHDSSLALEEAKKLGFPVFIKATAGGGGKGIRIAQSGGDFISLFNAAKKEAEMSFGDGALYLEKMILNPRHIEVQIVADKYGNVVHLGERDCSIQRRRQKLIEESPSTFLDEGLRHQIGEKAKAVVKEAGYTSCGTVEFLLDENKNFYFMEVNARIQVEHTITEEVTGIDLIKEQIKIARGDKLSFTQADVVLKGHSIEFRINAENPKNGFSPCPGKLEYYLPPGGPHVRVDSACYAGYVVPPYYDSMIAKLIVKGATREEAIMVAKRALAEFHIGGVDTTIPFHIYMLSDPKFLSGDFNLEYVDHLIEKGHDFIP